MKKDKRAKDLGERIKKVEKRGHDKEEKPLTEEHIVMKSTFDYKDDCPILEAYDPNNTK